MRKTNKIRASKNIEFIAKKLSDIDLKEKLLLVGNLLKSMREERKLMKAPNRRYEKGIDMRLSTFLTVLCIYNIPVEEFFRRLGEIQELKSPGKNLGRNQN